MNESERRAMRYTKGRSINLRSAGCSSLLVVLLLLAGCVQTSAPSAVETTVATLAPQVATAAGAAATAQAQSGAAVSQAATAQTDARAAISQAAAAQAQAATAVAQIAAVASPTVVASGQAGGLLLRLGLGIIAPSGTDQSVIAYPFDNVELYAEPGEVADDTRPVEFVLAEVVTGTFTLYYNEQDDRLAQVQVGGLLSAFATYAAITAGADTKLSSTSSVFVDEQPMGRITTKATFTKVDLAEVVNELGGANLASAYILLGENKSENKTDQHRVLITISRIPSGAGGDLFTLWCQACFGGICRLFCG